MSVKLKVNLPEGVLGKHVSDGECIDCGEVASVYNTEHGPVVVHQGIACNRFVKRFSTSEKRPNPTLAIDESGEWVEFPLGTQLVKSAPEKAKKLPESVEKKLFVERRSHARGPDGENG